MFFLKHYCTLNRIQKCVSIVLYDWETKSSLDLLYCDILFIELVWNWTSNISEVCPAINLLHFFHKINFCEFSLLQKLPFNLIMSLEFLSKTKIINLMSLNNYICTCVYSLKFMYIFIYLYLLIYLYKSAKIDLKGRI